MSKLSVHTYPPECISTDEICGFLCGFEPFVPAKATLPQWQCRSIKTDLRHGDCGWILLAIILLTCQASRNGLLPNECPMRKLEEITHTETADSTGQPSGRTKVCAEVFIQFNRSQCAAPRGYKEISCL
ncbi:hypothetical protein BC938DRAFT_471326 [Jimgerdemannia flammicorona]|uniref:Uncharacterized protein n=1 Tax=Jimgerdemannia flammicorona TaxID=994334 RepID=A0A433QUP3_9FUNG|nr:hypothetical protein BC938DRAFT_471326 [Jimgerdemannia flammicorona]